MNKAKIIFSAVGNGLRALMLCLLFCASPVWSFGAKGHSIVAAIAENHLSAQSLEAVEIITGSSRLEPLANWADRVKGNPNWNHSKSWHYISIDRNESFVGLRRNPDGDILLALEKAESQLWDPSLPKQKQRQALAFLIHLVADIHQPLHVGRRDDRGGNNIRVKWFGEDSNLHRVWDSGIIDNTILSPSAYARRLDQISYAKIKQWQNSRFVDWAEESKRLRRSAYDFTNKPGAEPSLGQQYAARHKPLVERRLQMAGIRLAARLNRLFANQD